MQPGPLGAVRHLARRLVHIFVPLPVGQIAQVAGARRTDHADPGIELLEPLVEGGHAQDAARHERRTALHPAFAAVRRRENLGIGRIHAFGDRPVFAHPARRQVAVTPCGIGGQRLALRQDGPARRRQRPRRRSLAQRDERRRVMRFGGVVAAAVAAVMADIERYVSLRNGLGLRGTVFVRMIDASGPFGTVGDFLRRGLRGRGARSQHTQCRSEELR